jgi:hypothetical protein
MSLHVTSRISFSPLRSRYVSLGLPAAQPAVQDPKAVIWWLRRGRSGGPKCQCVMSLARCVDRGASKATRSWQTGGSPRLRSL